MIPWNVIIMVLGVGILMNVISLSGGIDIMVDGLESVMGPKTAGNDHGDRCRSHVLLQFRSRCRIPDPDPTASGLAASIGGVTVLELVSVIVIGGTVSGFTPISTTGALIMAGVAQRRMRTRNSRRTACLWSCLRCPLSRLQFWLYLLLLEFIRLLRKYANFPNNFDYSIFSFIQGLKVQIHPLECLVNLHRAFFLKSNKFKEWIFMTFWHDELRQIHKIPAVFLIY